MALALRVQRLVAAVGASLGLLWGVLAGSAMFGLWAAVWILGLMSGGIGALVGEYHKQHTRDSDPRLVAESRLAMFSGFGYLVIAVVASWFPTVLAIAVLVAVVADFGAGHHVARSQIRPRRPRVRT